MSFISKIWSQKKEKTQQLGALANARELLKDKLTGDGKTVMYEFERLRRGDNVPAAEAERPENEKKNRYVNVLPFDSNRVVLAGKQSGYINASLLTSKSGEAPGWSYIATQGPLSSTVADFWLMVQQQKASVIVMLTRTKEGRHVEKCASYFAEEEGGIAKYGRFSVATVSCVELDGDITVRELRLKDEEASQERTVLHYHYHAWPDHGVPRTTAPLRRLSDLLRNSKPDAAPVVHCSAGIGRTGTFCVVDIVLRRLQQMECKDATEAERAVDIKRVVSNLRKQRMGMVQTPSQYLFCHQAVKEEIEEMLGVPDSAMSTAKALSPSE